MTAEADTFSDPSAEAVFEGHLSRVMEYSLVLASQHIPHQISCIDGHYRMLVAESDIPRSRLTIELYNNENEDWNNQSSQSPLAGDIKIKLEPLLLLGIPTVCFFAQISDWINSTLFVYLGRCDASKITSGEWWRVVTGLTLHADHQHFLSNLVAGFFILNLLMNKAGWGLAMFWISIAGVLGNTLTAIHLTPNHLSLGFSTCVFAALGALALIQTLEHYVYKTRAVKPWAPLAAAFFMVTLLGLGERADVHAHFYGFLSGMVTGLLIYWMEPHTKKSVYQVMFALATFALFGGAWWMAWR